MVTNDLKKGTRILLRNGWEATLIDNAKGNTRMANVEGYVTEVGSVYSHDIVAVLPGINAGPWHVRRRVEHTPAQIKLMGQVKAMGF